MTQTALPRPLLAPVARTRDAASTLALSLAAAVHAALVLGLGFRPFDDTFITFRYALNVGDGHGLVYNAGEHVLGTTTPLWALVLGAAHRLGVALPTAALVLSALADTAGALLLARLLKRLRYPQAVSVGAAVLFLCLADVVGLSRSGMETSLFALVLLATLERLAAGRLATAASLAAASLTVRPEGVLLLVVVAGWVVATRPPRKTLAFSAALAAAVAGGWLAFVAAFYGSPLPQSLVAKAADPVVTDGALSWSNLKHFFVEGQSGAGDLTRTYLQGNWLLTLLAVVAVVTLLSAARRDPLARRRSILLVAFPFAYVGVLGAAHAFTFFPWYFGPLYPFLAALAAAGLGGLRGRFGSAAVAAGVALIIALQAAALIAIKLPAERNDYWVAGLTRSIASVPRSARVTVAAREIGVVGYRLYPARVEDLYGLVTPAAVGVSSAAYIAQHRPDFVSLRTDEGATLMTAMAALPALRSQYRLVANVGDPHASRLSERYLLYARWANQPPAIRSR